MVSAWASTGTIRRWARWHGEPWGVTIWGPMAGWVLFSQAPARDDLRQWRKGTVVLPMTGANSISIYLFHEILLRWTTQAGLVFTQWMVKLDEPFGQFLNANPVIAFQVYVCYWLYRRRIFFKR